MIKLQNGEVVEDSLNYIYREKDARNNLIQYLINAGLNYRDIEEVILRYEGVTQNLYLELGLKVGAKLGAEYLL